MTLPEFSDLVSDHKSSIIIKNCFEECTALYLLLKDNYKEEDLSIIMDSSKVSKGKCRFVINTNSLELKKDMIDKFKSLTIDVFKTQLQVKTRPVKNNNLSMNITKK